MGLRKSIIIIISICVFFNAFSLGEQEDQDPLLLKIGDASRKEEQIEIRANALYSLKESKQISFSEMIQEIKSSGFVYIGESHNDLAMHDFQYRVIRELHESGVELVIGLEMLTPDLQETLNKWWLGLLTKEQFIQEIRWYENWNLNFGFYEKIFFFAKDFRIPIYGLNAPRKVISKIRMQGWEALSHEEKKLVPEPDLEHQEHRLLIRTIFENTELPPQMKGPGLEMVFEGLYRAQSAWDEVMAENSLKIYGSQKKMLVVLAGSGHLLYNLGINRRAYERSNLPFSTLIPIAVPPEKNSILISRSVSDYVWAIPEQSHPAFPAIGLSFKKFDDMENLVIDRITEDGLGENAGFKKGDVILTVDGERFSSLNDIHHYLSRFNWGGQVSFRVLREGKIEVILLEFNIPRSDEKKSEE